MTEMEKYQGQAAITGIEDIERAKYDVQAGVVDTWKDEGDEMFELEKDVVLEFGDRTFRAEYELKRFLDTLTDEQLALTEVLVDDDEFVVFYPMAEAVEVRRSGFHFDTDTPRPTVTCADVPELVGVSAGQSGSEADRNAGLAILLASVRL